MPAGTEKFDFTDKVVVFLQLIIFDMLLVRQLEFNSLNLQVWSFSQCSSCIINLKILTSSVIQGCLRGVNLRVMAQLNLLVELWHVLAGATRWQSRAAVGMAC